jgi:hypothetical protein
MPRIGLPEQDSLDNDLPDLVIDVEEDADDRARDEDDHGSLEDLVLVRPFDLLELGPGLPDEADGAAESSARSGARRDGGPRPEDSLRSPCLAGLPVRLMLPAPAAELRELHAVRRVPLRFVRLVVAPLALGAGEGDRNSDSCLGHV